MEVIFRGTRGTSPCSGQQFVTYGGATSCVQVNIRDMQFFFDAGTGIMSYDVNVALSDRYYIFLSHLHYDHVQGLPFFAPMFAGGAEIRIYGSKPKGISLADAVEQLIRPPYLPFSVGNYPAQIEIHEIEFGEKIEIDSADGDANCLIETFALEHPGGSVAYKLTDSETGKTFVYVTDTTMPHGKRRDALVDFIGATDLLVADSFFTDAEMQGEQDGINKSDWGHMSWEEAVNLGSFAGVKRLALFHHHNGRDDDAINRLQERAQTLFKDSFCAYDNQIVIL